MTCPPLATSKQLKILFIHGLESGPMGRKVIALKNDFYVYSPDMHMSVMNICKKNSIFLNLFKQQICFLACALTLLIFAIVGYYSAIFYSAFVLYFVILLIFHRVILGCAIQKSFQTCVEIQKSAILEYKPDLIIGSSFGGAIALQLLKDCVWSGPTIIICPAYLKMQCLFTFSMLCTHYNDKLYEKKMDFIANVLRIAPAVPNMNVKDGKWILVHGRNDSTINVHDSELIHSLNENMFDLRIVDDNGHKMKTFVTNGQLNQLVNEYMQ